MESLVGKTVAIQNLGQSGNLRWLNGDPNGGNVDLMEVQFDPNTGRNWEMRPVDQQGRIVQFLNQGKNGSDRYLYGDTSDGRVQLELDGTSPGTQWLIEEVSSNVFNLINQGTGGDFKLLNGDPNGGGVNMATEATSGGTNWNILIFL